MNRRYVFALLAALTAIFVGVSCAPPADPSADSGLDNNGDEDAMEQVEDTDDPDDDPDAGNPTDDAGGDTSDYEIDPASCALQSDFTGQIGNTEASRGGGTPAPDDSVYKADAGLQAVYDYISNNKSSISDGSDGGYAIPEADQMQVSGAVITATHGGKNLPFFFLQDQQTGLQARLSQGHDSVASAIKTGAQVSFTVTGVDIYYGRPQITSITDFSVDATGKKVAIHEVDGGSLDKEMFHQIVRVSFTLDKGASECGPMLCYDMLDQNGNNIGTFRSDSFFDEGGYTPGTCLTYVGPLGQHPGPLAESPGGIQLQELNWDWTRRPPVE